MLDDKIQAKPSPVQRILSRFRSRPKEESPKPSNSKNPTSKSKDSPFRRALNRVSFSKKHGIEKSLQDAPNVLNEGFRDSPTVVLPKWPTSSPRPAHSECDLRLVTISRGSDFPTPLAGAPQFLSEDNLATSDCGIPIQERVPSYLKISCTLNGYRSPRPAIENTPIRPAAGKSLIERRLAQLRGSPLSDTIRSEKTFTANGLADTSMGSTCSSPSVKALIGQFDRWKLCHDDTDSCNSESKENIKPCPVIRQPVAEKPLKDVCDVTASTSQKSSKTTSISVDSTPVSSARSGDEFKETVISTRRNLEEKSQLALKDLEKQPNMPDEAADNIRMASGKAALLIRKKISKFEELVQANLHPETAEKVTTTEDLEGYWALVELELTDINGIFSEVDSWRSRNFEPAAVAVEEIASKIIQSNNNEKPKPRPKVAAPKPLTEKQKQAAEDRKKAIAEARAKMEKKKEEILIL